MKCYLPAVIFAAIVTLLAACELSPDRGPLGYGFGGYYPAGPAYTGDLGVVGYKAPK